MKRVVLPLLALSLMTSVASAQQNLRIGLAEGPDIILLDNFSIQNLVLAVALRNQIAPLVLLEASGGIGLENLREVALTGIDRISVGGLIHQARSIALALDYETS